jgi:hypothetical protein
MSTESGRQARRGEVRRDMVGYNRRLLSTQLDPPHTRPRHVEGPITVEGNICWRQLHGYIGCILAGLQSRAVYSVHGPADFPWVQVIVDHQSCIIICLECGFHYFQDFLRGATNPRPFKIQQSRHTQYTVGLSAALYCAA